MMPEQVEREGEEKERDTGERFVGHGQCSKSEEVIRGTLGIRASFINQFTKGRGSAVCINGSSGIHGA